LKAEFKKFTTFFYVAVFVLTIAISSCGKDENIQNKTKTEKSTVKDTVKDTVTNREVTSGNDFVIEYNMMGAMKGKMTIYRSGTKLKQVIESVVLGIKNTNEIYIQDKFVFSVTNVAGKKFGIKTNITDYNNNKQTGETITDFTEFQKFIGTKRVIGNETILEQKCDIYETAPDVSISVSDKKYVLQIKTSQFLALATKLDKAPVFTAAEFQIPSDVDFKSIGNDKVKQEVLDSIIKKQNENRK